MLIFGEELQAAENRDADCPRAHAVPGCLLEQKRDFERTAPRRWKRRQHVVEGILEQIP